MSSRTNRIRRWLCRDASAGQVALHEDRAEALQSELRQAHADYNEVSESLRDQNEMWKRARAECNHYKTALLDIVENSECGHAESTAGEALAAWRRA